MSNIDKKLMFEATEALYTTSLDETGWVDLLEILRINVPEIRVGLQYRDADFQIEPRNLIRGYDAGFVKTYMQHFKDVDASSPILRTSRVGKTHVVTDPGNSEQFFGREFYHDWIRPQDDIGNAFGTVLSRDQLGTFFMACHLPSGMHPSQVERIYATLSELTPLMVRAARLTQQLATEKARSASMAAALDHLASSVLCLDRSGRMIYGNPQAEALLRAGEVVRTGLDGRIRFCDTTAEWQFHQALASDPAEPHSTALTSFAAMDRQRGVRHSVAVIPGLGGGSRNLPFANTAGAAAVVLITSPDTLPIPAAATLRSVFRLTGAEAAVADQLARGQTLGEIAAATGVKESTIRSQIKATMVKMDVSRQSDIVRHVLSLGGGFDLGRKTRR